MYRGLKQLSAETLAKEKMTKILVGERAREREGGGERDRSISMAIPSRKRARRRKRSRERPLSFYFGMKWKRGIVFSKRHLREMPSSHRLTKRESEMEGGREGRRERERVSAQKTP